jgi:uncharacterized protein YjiS (DUF1127 family)
MERSAPVVPVGAKRKLQVKTLAVLETTMSVLFAIRSFTNTDARETAVETLGRHIARLFDALLTKLAAERSRRELMTLNSYMLNDLGLTRDDLGLRVSELNRVSLWKAKGHPEEL